MDTRTKENIVDARIKKVLGTRTDTGEEVYFKSKSTNNCV